MTIFKKNRDTFSNENRKSQTVLLRTLVFFIFLSIVSLSYGQEKPNILVIYVDDLGYADIGINGQVEDVKTPNIDALAMDGVRFTSGYVTAPQCIPSRAGLLTGKYQQKFGLDHNGTIPLPLDETLLPERLEKGGYVTGMTGKWHLDPNHQQKEWILRNLPELDKKEAYKPSDIPFEKKEPYMSSNRGFTKTFQGYRNNYWANYTLEKKKIKAQWIEQPGYRLDIQTAATLRFIHDNHARPFFFYLSYFAPHVPMEATEKYLNRFPEEMPLRRKYCLAMMSAIDDGIGRIANTLKDYGIYENTMIFFISDNGAPLKITMEDKPISFQGGAWDGSLNTPFNGEKGMLLEGGIRIPYIVSWPKGLPKNVVSDLPVSTLDVAATSLAVANIGSVDEHDGLDLLEYLKRNNPQERTLFWRFWQQSAIRKGNFKYLKWNDREFLFDLSKDPKEKNNLLNTQPTVAKQLRKKLTQWNNQLKNKKLPMTGLDQEKKWYRHYLGSK